MSKLTIHVRSPTVSSMKIWTLDEDVYVEISGVTYVQQQSMHKPPTFLSLLVSVFDTECAGRVSDAPFKHVNVSVNTYEAMTRSGARMMISFDLGWSCYEHDYEDNDYRVVFVRIADPL